MAWLILLSFVAAFLLGIWLGRPRPYEPSLEEIEARLQQVGGEHAQVKRARTYPVRVLQQLLQRKQQRGSERRRERGRKAPFSRLG